MTTKNPPDLMLRVYSQTVPEMFHHQVTDQRSRERDGKIGRGENVVDRPHQTFSPCGSGPCEFSHQEVRIKEEDDETNLDDGSPDTSLHLRNVAGNYFTTTVAPN